MNSQDTTFEAVANRVARRDLDRLARHGMEQHSHAMSELRASQYERRFKLPGSQYGFLVGWLPRAASDPRDTGLCAGGFFEGKNCLQILQLCLTEEALALLLEESCNQYQFWQNIRALLEGGFSDPLPVLPFISNHVEDRIVKRRWNYQSDSISGLKNLIRLRGDSFDLNQLDVAQAIDLLRDGVLLLHAPEPGDYGKAAKLVLNPVWLSRFVTDVTADSCAPAPEIPAP
jgi:hypothetical protein